MLHSMFRQCQCSLNSQDAQSHQGISITLYHTKNTCWVIKKQNQSSKVECFCLNDSRNGSDFPKAEIVQNYLSADMAKKKKTQCKLNDSGTAVFAPDKRGPKVHMSACMVQEIFTVIPDITLHHSL